MTNKLKCWKKLNETKTELLFGKNRKRVVVQKNKNGWIISTSPLGYGGKAKTIKIKSKSDAKREAERIMKSHNKC